MLHFHNLTGNPVEIGNGLTVPANTVTDELVTQWYNGSRWASDQILIGLLINSYTDYKISSDGVNVFADATIAIMYLTNLKEGAYRTNSMGQIEVSTETESDMEGKWFTYLKEVNQQGENILDLKCGSLDPDTEDSLSTHGFGHLKGGSYIISPDSTGIDFMNDKLILRLGYYDEFNVFHCLCDYGWCTEKGIIAGITKTFNSLSLSDELPLDYTPTIYLHIVYNANNASPSIKLAVTLWLYRPKTTEY